MTQDFQELEWAVEDEFHDDWEWIENEYEEFEHDIEEDLDDWGIEGEDLNGNIEHDAGVFWRLVTITGPWLFFDIIFQWWNLEKNMLKDYMWAGGNYFLLFNTAVSLFQGICSFLLVAEFPTYLGTRGFGSRLVRGFSMMLASVYNLVYFYFGCELLFSMWMADDEYTGW